MQQNNHTYDVYKNDELEVTYYIRENGMSKEGFKNYFVVQAFNQEALVMNEFEVNDLKKLLSLTLVGIMTEKEVLREQTAALQNTRSNWTDLA